MSTDPAVVTPQEADALSARSVVSSLPATMSAARWWARGDVRVDTVPVPDGIPPGWALVEVLACGICGTDLEEFRSGPIVVPLTPHPLTGRRAPITMGHETVGRIVASNDAQAPPVGTVVAVEGNLHCGECFWCQRHEFPLCEKLATLGQMGDGGLADYLLAPGYTCIPVPDGVSPVEAVLAEPLAVVCRALRRNLDRVRDASVAVFGAGTIGLLALQAALSMGAREVRMIDPNPGRRDLALQLGAADYLSPDDVGLLAGASRAGGPDLVIECAGRTEAAEAAIGCVRRGGTVLLLGVHDDDARFNLLRFLIAEKRVIASVSHVYDEDFPVAMDLIGSGRIATKELITSVIPLSRTVTDGFDRLRHPGSQIKVVVVPDRLLSASTAAMEQT